MLRSNAITGDLIILLSFSQNVIRRHFYATMVAPPRYSGIAEDVLASLQSTFKPGLIHFCEPLLISTDQKIVDYFRLLPRQFIV
jgi:hypothetical protein